MKISTRGRYGLRILVDLAMQEADKPRLIKEIAESQQISKKYISQLIVDLRVAGLICSVRGAKGGLVMAKKAEDISLRAIIEAMEGELAIVDCIHATQDCERYAACQTRNVWERLNCEIRNSMEQITLAEIIANDNEPCIG